MKTVILMNHFPAYVGTHGSHLRVWDQQVDHVPDDELELYLADARSKWQVTIVKAED